MYAVSYAIIFAFHPDLNLDRVITERSFGHSKEKPCSLSYLINKQFRYINMTTLKQLRDCALNVSTKPKKIAISEMFSTELKFASDCLLKWFNAKFKSQYITLNKDAKRKYEVEIPLNKEKERCCICTFPTEINPTMWDATKEQTSYADFIIQKEHKFLRNIFSEEEIPSTRALKDISTFYERFTKFLHISIYLQNVINTTVEFSDSFYKELLEFCKELFSDCENFTEIAEKIAGVEIKNSSTTKIKKKTLHQRTFPEVNSTMRP